ncbi:hypothetical protein VHEMI04540 [[Torrubiella] hemipterigena]|uniref:Uncharacterized protein n=1 Tax=[Torrubiella] hemipterigena TaxID=1531966 RepID=A0A0A1TGM6_9HYPO|nr:hypothetical protein VHEMI04540 [[Torrubiella] hemipterigena]
MERDRETRHDDDGTDASEGTPLLYNVFHGGQVRKKRKTLDEAAVDSDVEPKLLKRRYQNIILTRSNARDVVTAPKVFPKHLIPPDEREVSPEPDETPQDSSRQGLRVTLEIGAHKDSVDAILHEPNQRLRPLINSHDTLHLDGLCRGEDFPVRKEDGAIIQKVLASGALLPRDDPTLTDNLADNLTAQAAGLFGRVKHAILLVYPTQCAAWFSRLDVDSEDQELSKLQYLVFVPTESLASQLSVILRPLTIPRVAPEIWTFFTNTPLLSSPDDLFITPQTHIFLLFPYGAAGQVQSAILTDFLRLVYPACQLFSSASPNDWSAFCKMTKGIIIAHERCIPLPHKVRADRDLDEIVSQLFIFHMPEPSSNSTLPLIIDARYGIWLERVHRHLLSSESLTHL